MPHRCQRDPPESFLDPIHQRAHRRRVVRRRQRPGEVVRLIQALHPQGGLGQSNPLHGATRVQPGLSVVGHDLHVRLTPLTVGYFTNNPLINIRLGGFVIPIEEEASLGAAFDVAILDNDGISLFHGKGKVVAKDGHRIGIRLSDIDKSVLARLQAEVAKLSPGGR